MGDWRDRYRQFHYPGNKDISSPLCRTLCGCRSNCLILFIHRVLSSGRVWRLHEGYSWSSVLARKHVWMPLVAFPPQKPMRLLYCYYWWRNQNAWWWGTQFREFRWKDRLEFGRQRWMRFFLTRLIFLLMRKKYFKINNIWKEIRIGIFLKKYTLD